MATTPPRSRVGPQPSDRSEPSPAKNQRTAVVDEVEILSDDDITADKYDGEQEEQLQEEEEEEEDVYDGDLDPVEDIATPPHR